MTKTKTAAAIALAFLIGAGIGTSLQQFNQVAMNPDDPNTAPGFDPDSPDALFDEITNGGPSGPLASFPEWYEWMQANNPEGLTNEDHYEYAWWQ